MATKDCEMRYIPHVTFLTQEPYISGTYTDTEEQHE